jgi:ubiquitin-like protein Pup
MTEQEGRETDAVLDEVGRTLDPNAEEFVKGFVQKGGE